MKTDRRQLLLKITLAAVAGLFLLDSLVIEPAFHAIGNQIDRIKDLRDKVQRGSQLCARGPSLRDRWAEMLRANLPADADPVTYKAWDRWVRESQISVTSFVPQSQWQTHDEGFETLECRAVAIGSQAALGRFLYELESDTSVPVNLEECEFTTRDPRGSQLTLTARITFLRLKETPKNPAP